MKIIVTGANGQLGSELKQIANNIANTEFFYTDIDTLDLSNQKDLENYIANTAPSIIINCAAYTAVDKAETDQDNAALINTKVPEHLAKLSKSLNFKLIHISTDYVFSGEQFLPTTEDTPTEPKSVYGKTKLLGEQLVQAASDAVIIRTSWLYSVFGHNFVKSMLKFGAERDQLGVVYDQVGTPTNAADLAQAIANIINNYHSTTEWKSGIYHFSNEGVCSWYDFAIAIMEQAQLNCKVNPIRTEEYPVPAPRPAFSVMNKEKIKETFNFAIPYWRDSLKVAVDKILKNN